MIPASLWKVLFFFISWETGCVNPELPLNNLLLCLRTLQPATFCDTGSNLAKEQKEYNLCLGVNHACKMSAQGNFSQIIYSNYNSRKQVHNGITGTTSAAATPARHGRGCCTPRGAEGWDAAPAPSWLHLSPSTLCSPAFSSHTLFFFYLCTPDQLLCRRSVVQLAHSFLCIKWGWQFSARHKLI